MFRIVLQGALRILSRFLQIALLLIDIQRNAVIRLGKPPHRAVAILHPRRSLRNIGQGILEILYRRFKIVYHHRLVARFQALHALDLQRAPPHFFLRGKGRRILRLHVRLLLGRHFLFRSRLGRFRSFLVLNHHFAGIRFRRGVFLHRCSGRLFAGRRSHRDDLVGIGSLRRTRRLSNRLCRGLNRRFRHFDFSGLRGLDPGLHRRLFRDFSFDRGFNQFGFHGFDRGLSRRFRDRFSNHGGFRFRRRHIRRLSRRLVCRNGLRRQHIRVLRGGGNALGRRIGSGRGDCRGFFTDIRQQGFEARILLGYRHPLTQEAHAGEYDHGFSKSHRKLLLEPFHALLFPNLK